MFFPVLILLSFFLVLCLTRFNCAQYFDKFAIMASTGVLPNVNSVFFEIVIFFPKFKIIKFRFFLSPFVIDRNTSCANDKIATSTSPTQTKCSESLTDTKNTSISKTVYETCLDFSSSIKQAKDCIYQQVKRSPLNSILARLSITAGTSVDGGKGEQPCEKCGRSGGRSNFLAVPTDDNKTRTNMMTSTPIMKDVGYNADFFKVIHVEKTELHDLSPRVTDYHCKCFFS